MARKVIILGLCWVGFNSYKVKFPIQIAIRVSTWCFHHKTWLSSSRMCCTSHWRQWVKGRCPRPSAAWPPPPGSTLPHCPPWAAFLRDRGEKSHLTISDMWFCTGLSISSYWLLVFCPVPLFHVRRECKRKDQGLKARGHWPAVACSTGDDLREDISLTQKEAKFCARVSFH